VRRWLEEYVNSSPRLTKRFKWEVEAHGEEKPVAPNKSASGRAKNRRVELVLWER
jgi:outer membrane protein OmpA-like peptidoglycan-associated protein